LFEGRSLFILFWLKKKEYQSAFTRIFLTIVKILNNMEPGFLIFGFVFTAIIVFFIFIRIRHLHLSDDKIEDAIGNYYENKWLIVNDIVELDFTEKIKNGVPIISIFRFYSYYFGVLSGKIDYVRKVDVIDHKDNEQTKFIELTVQGNDIISLNELASYDI